MSISDVATFREQQALSERAGRAGLSGFALVASHESITARMERGADRILELVEQGRHDEAQALMSLPDWGAGRDQAVCCMMVALQEERKGKS